MPGMVTDGPDSRGRRPPHRTDRPGYSPGYSVTATAPADPGGGDAAELVDLGHVVRPADSRRDRWTGPAAVGLAAVVLIAGLMFASRPDLAIVAASPQPSPSGSDSIAVASPRAADPARPTKAPPPSLPCQSVPPAEPVDVILRWASGSWHPGVKRDGPFEVALPETWTGAFDLVQTLDPEQAMRVVNLGRIDLTTSEPWCLSSWSVTAVKLEGPGVLAAFSLGQAKLDPAGIKATFVAPPVGSWLLRILAELPTFSGPRFIEAYAQLTVGDWPTGEAAQVQPAVPCGSDRAQAGATLIVDGRSVVGVALSPAGSPGPVSTPISVPLGAELLVVTEAERCAVGWSIDAIPGSNLGNRGPRQLAWYDNAVLDQAIAAQNRFPLALGPIGGDWDIVARLKFADGTRVDIAWAVRVEGLTVPPLLIGRMGHAAVAKAWVGCGFSLHLRNGYEASDACESNLPEEPLETFVVGQGDRLTFDGGGWSIVDWWQATTGVFRGEPAAFEEKEGGFLRSASSPPVDFPVPKSIGTWTLGLGTCLVRDGNQICGTWYVKVDVR